MALDPYFAPHEGGDGAFSLDPSAIKFGRGVLAEVGEDARAQGMTRAAVFADPAVAKLAPVATVTAALRAAGIDAVLYDEIVVEPTDRSFQKATEFARDGRFDGFVSVGGGSTMDTAKAANLYSSWPADFMAYVNAPIGRAEPVPGPLKPHIACPTTFGTASECTGIAICDFIDLEVKSGIISRRLKPTLGVLDPSALATLPANVVAANAFDVLCHAIESLTARPYSKRPKPASATQRPLSQGANPYSDLACLEAVRLAGHSLVRAVREPDAEDARESLMFSGMLAGIGFGNAGCHLPHGMSYAVAGLVRDYRAPDYPSNHAMVPHGISVVVNAPAVFRFTGPACPERHLRAADALGADTKGADSADGGAILADRLAAMMRETGLPNGLMGVGYGPEDIPALTEGAWKQQRLIVNMPCALSKDQLASLFKDAMRYW